MDWALVTLLRLRLRSGLRRSFRNIRTVRGMIFFLLGLVTVVLWLGPSVVSSLVHHRHFPPESLHDVLPLTLAGLALMSVITATRQEGIPFSPAEVDFLFSGPFTRRELLFYRLSAGVGGALFLALFASIPLLQYGSSWLAAVLGAWQAAVFIQFFTTALVLLKQRIGQSLHTRFRKLLLLAVVGLLVVLGVQWLADFQSQGPMEAIRRLRSSPLGFCLLLPLEPFCRTITAQRLVPDLLGWGTISFAIDAAMLALLVRIDVDYLEASLAASLRRHQMIQQQRRTGRMATRARVSWRVPMLPWLSGAGPIAWRQMTIAVRGSLSLLPLLLVVLGVSIVPLFLSRRQGVFPAEALVGQVAFITMIMTRAVAFDFRGDLDALAWLKSLPLRPASVALGQLVTPALLMTAVHLVVLGGVAMAAPKPGMLLAAAAAFSLPFNMLLFGVDNLLFLLFPVRAGATAPGDLQHIGRMMLEMTVKIAVMGLAAGSAALMGLAGYWASGQSWIVAVCWIWLTLSLLAGLTIPCLAWAYARFDLSTDTPG